MNHSKCVLRTLNVCDGESLPTTRWAGTERCYCARIQAIIDQDVGADVSELRWHRARAVARASELERRAWMQQRMREHWCESSDF